MLEEKVREGSHTELVFPLTDADSSGANLRGKRVEVVVADKNGDKEETRTFSNLDALPLVLVGARNQTQLISVEGTTGSFKLRYKDQVTDALFYNARAEQVEAALAALPKIGPGNVRCSGGPLGTRPIKVEFVGPLFSLDQPMLVALEHFEAKPPTITGQTRVIFRPQIGTFKAELSPYKIYLRAIDPNGTIRTYPESETDGFFIKITVEKSYLVTR